MIDRICLLLEALSVVICLHHLYGEKFRLDIKTVGFLAVDMIMMTAIQYYQLPQTLSGLIFPIIIVYCILKFGFNFKAVIVNNILYIVIVSVIQYIMVIIIYNVVHIQKLSSINLLIINLGTFLITLGMRKIRLNQVSLYFQEKGRLLIASLICCVCIVLYCLFKYKQYNKLDFVYYTLFFICIVLMCVLMINVGKYKLKSKEIETELKMHKMYESSFRNLIENIRIRQHEFDNHINAIFNQHYMYHTYDELVYAQKEYCNVVLEENRFNKILSKGNPVIICFLYGKFLEIEKHGIEVTYRISINELEVGIPVYKMVEILGDLINNAVEALMQGAEEKKLHVSIVEIDEKVIMEIRNTSKDIPLCEISRFFEKGYSKKGSNRGLGLFNVKKICDEYGFKVECENKEIDDSNWLLFRVYNE